MIVSGKYPGLSGLRSTLVGEDEEIHVKIQHGLEMDGGDSHTTM